MVMVKIGKHYYDISIAWPLIILAFMIGIALFVPAVAWLQAFFAG